MLKEVRAHTNIRAKDFLKFLDRNQKKKILQLADELKGKRILHVNATAEGGGVAEILHSLIPYLNSLGIQSSRYVIDPRSVKESFFVFTKKLHNALQGQSVRFSKKDWQQYEAVNKEIAADLARIGYDVLVVHDPQPLGSIAYLDSDEPNIFVLHIDTSSPFRPVWQKVAAVILKYDRILFSNRGFINGSLPIEKLSILSPAIDPLSIKQEIVPAKKARENLVRYGIPKDGPLIVQVSRFDVWKNPIGVVEAFLELEHTYPSAYLALIGLAQAKDDPESYAVYEQVKELAGASSRISLFIDPKRIWNIPQFTMMAQNAADIVVQNSTKEGFGLVVTEAMWKGKVVVGGPASGIRKQITHGKNGYIAQNPHELAERMADLLAHPGQRTAIGKAAKESVRKNFLMPRLVLDHLKVYKNVLR